MLRSLHTAGQGMIAQQLNVDTISNNLANVDTTAFKKSRVEFQDLLYETFDRANVLDGAEGRPVNLQVGHGVRPIATVKNFTSGNLEKTDMPLDFAIGGDGFFKVNTPNGIAYTRDGSFKLSVVDEGNMLTTSNGNPVLDEDEQEIIIPPNLDLNDLVISDFGELSYMGKTMALTLDNVNQDFLQQVRDSYTDPLEIYNILADNMEEDIMDQIDQGEFEVNQDLIDVINTSIIGNEDFIDQIEEETLTELEDNAQVQELLALREDGQISAEDSQKLNLLVLQSLYPNSIEKRLEQADWIPMNQTISVVHFPNKHALENIGANLYMGTEAAGEEIQNQDALKTSFITQGFLESSNVQIVEEMVDLITAQRAYETNSKAIQTSDDMLNTANTLKR